MDARVKKYFCVFSFAKPRTSAEEIFLEKYFLRADNYLQNSIDFLLFSENAEIRGEIKSVQKSLWFVFL